VVVVVVVVMEWWWLVVVVVVVVVVFLALELDESLNVIQTYCKKFPGLLKTVGIRGYKTCPQMKITNERTNREHTNKIHVYLNLFPNCSMCFPWVPYNRVTSRTDSSQYVAVCSFYRNTRKRIKTTQNYTQNGLDDRSFESRQGLRISLFTTVSRPALGPTQPLIQWVPGFVPLGVEWPGREADHSPPSSPEVKNAWSYTSTPTKRLHGVVLSKKHGDNFTFTFRK
jgi:hypothetical protein